MEDLRKWSFFFSLSNCLMQIIIHKIQNLVILKVKDNICLCNEGKEEEEGNNTSFEIDKIVSHLVIDSFKLVSGICSLLFL